MKKFACEFCGEKFSYEISLTEHVEKHKILTAENDGGDLMMMMVDNAGDIETETVQTEIVDTFQHEQIVECETVFENDNFEISSAGDNFETHTITTTFYEKGDRGVESPIDMDQELEKIRKSPRKRFAKKSFEDVYAFKKQRQKL